MSDHDPFENRVRRMLNDSVDARLRDTPRTPPPFRASPALATRGHRSRRARTRWLPPLLAAACIAAAVLASIAGAKLINADPRPAVPDPNGPTTLRQSPEPSATPSTTAPSPFPDPSRTAKSTPTTIPPLARQSSATATPKPPATRQVSVLGATFTLPRDWEARNFNRYRDYDGGSDSFCLTPSSLPVPRDRTCPLKLSLVTDYKKFWLDPDAQTGFDNNFDHCAGSKTARYETDYGVRDFGGRDAEWRSWRIGCADGRTYNQEQYETPTAVPYILFAEKVTNRIHDVMTTVVRTAQLPAATRPLRLADSGRITSIRRSGATATVTLARQVRIGSKRRDQGGSATYRMPVSKLTYDHRSAKRGSTVSLWTDGRKVIEFVFG